MFFFDILGGVSCLAMMFVHPELNEFHKQMSLVLPLAGKFALTGKALSSMVKNGSSMVVHRRNIFGENFF